MTGSNTGSKLAQSLRRAKDQQAPEDITPEANKKTTTTQVIKTSKIAKPKAVTPAVKVSAPKASAFSPSRLHVWPD